MNNLDPETYPLGTVDGIAGLWRAAPQAGYAKDQEFTRDQWAITHHGDWSFGHSMVSLSSVATDNHGRTLPLTVTERLLHREIFQGSGACAGMNADGRRALMVQTCLPRPKRMLQSSQYVLDAKLDMPVGENHYV